MIDTLVEVNCLMQIELIYFNDITKKGHGQ